MHAIKPRLVHEASARSYFNAGRLIPIGLLLPLLELLQATRQLLDILLRPAACSTKGLFCMSIWLSLCPVSTRKLTKQTVLQLWAESWMSSQPAV